MQKGPRGTSFTAVSRQSLKPAENKAAATVSPLRHCTGWPLMVTVTGSWETACAASGNLLNMKPPGRAWGYFVGQLPLCQHGRQAQGMCGRQRDAAMTGGDKGPGMRRGLVVDWEAVFGHHAQCPP